MKKHHFHNTTDETGELEQSYEYKAYSQDQQIADYFERNPGEIFTPWEIQSLVFDIPYPPITSIRRAMSNLTRDGVLTKTKHKKEAGEYGRRSYAWMLNEKYWETVRAMEIVNSSTPTAEEILEAVLPPDISGPLLGRKSTYGPKKDPQGDLFPGQFGSPKTATCQICGRELTNPISIAAGIGPVCAGSHDLEIEAKRGELPMIAPVMVMAWREPSGSPRTNIRQLIVDHSPDGFEWGYGGSGPADFALNILYTYTRDKELSYRYHQDFKRDFIAGMPESGGEISGVVISQWIQDRAKGGKA